MSSHFTKTGFLFLWIAIASCSSRDAAGGEEDAIPLTKAEWIASAGEHGLKTLSERWDRPGSSLNHCMFGHIQEWFHMYLLGIRQAPGSTGYEKVLIDPFIPDDLQWARGSFDSPNGRIEVAWIRKGGTVEVTINAAKADIVVPREREDVQWKRKRIN